MLEKVGTITYRLKLPPSSHIHTNFHISQLRSRIDKEEAVEPTFPILGPDGGIRLLPEMILARK
jgi:hypothetical protein